MAGRVFTPKLRLAFLKCAQMDYHRIFKALNLEHANSRLRKAFLAEITGVYAKVSEGGDS